MNGRPPLPGGVPDEVVRIREQARKLDVDLSRPKPLVLGRHLLDLGHRLDVRLGKF